MDQNTLRAKIVSLVVPYINPNCSPEWAIQYLLAVANEHAGLPALYPAGTVHVTPTYANAPPPAPSPLPGNVQYSQVTTGVDANGNFSVSRISGTVPAGQVHSLPQQPPLQIPRAPAPKEKPESPF
jgi:hypothetical protein